MLSILKLNSTTLYIALVMLMLLNSGCKKEEIVTVSNNNAPVDNTVSELVIDNYINKTFISAIGREPIDIEHKYYKQEFLSKGFAEAQRRIFVADVFKLPDYRSHIYNLYIGNILNGQDTAEVSQYIALFQLLLSDTTYYPFWTLLQYEQGRLITFQQFTTPWKNGTKKMSELHTIFVNNYFYDQINMGSLNYVTSVFQHFLKRNPTSYEEQMCVEMIDDKSAILFGITGKGKNDFNNIIFHSAEYYEGAVREMFERYLFRVPTNAELGAYTLKYKSTNNYEQLQIDLLVTNEFAGL